MKTNAQMTEKEPKTVLSKKEYVALEVLKILLKKNSPVLEGCAVPATLDRTIEVLTTIATKVTISLLNKLGN
jgi:hypothetical protein